MNIKTRLLTFVEWCRRFDDQAFLLITFSAASALLSYLSGPVQKFGVFSGGDLTVQWIVIALCMPLIPGAVLRQPARNIRLMAAASATFCWSFIFILGFAASARIHPVAFILFALLALASAMNLLGVILNDGR